jgi:parvulin-like peptidyl-prolyl isomerase
MQTTSVSGVNRASLACPLAALFWVAGVAGFAMPSAHAATTLASSAAPGKPAGVEGHGLGVAVARLNDAPLFGLTLDVFFRSARQKDSSLTPAAMLEQLIANRLLAAQVPLRFAQYDLSANRRVAFEPEVALEDQLVASLRPLFDANNAPLDDKTLRRWKVESLSPDPALWDQVFGKPGKLLLDYNLNPEQSARAKSVVLLRSQLPAARSMTVFDLMRRQNVQGRVEFFNRNFEYVQQQARQRLGSLIVLDWAQRFYGAPAVADLRAALREREQSRALLALHGIGADIDGDSALMDALAQKVSGDEIKAYYFAHKSEFARIVKVKARHIRVADEALAQKVSAQLAKGQDFAQLAQQVSIADDAKQGGDLGWIVHDAPSSWLLDLAFTQNTGQVSPPFRSPVGPNETAVWEIVKVEQREDGYQAIDSESVRHTASRAVASQKAAQQIMELKHQLRKQAKVQVLAPAFVPAPVPVLAPVTGMKVAK